MESHEAPLPIEKRLTVAERLGFLQPPKVSDEAAPPASSGMGASRSSSAVSWMKSPFAASPL